MRLQLQLRFFGEFGNEVIADSRLDGLGRHRNTGVAVKSNDPRFDVLCRIACDGYFKVVGVLPIPLNGRLFNWFEVKPRLLTPASEADIVAWDRSRLANWEVNEFGYSHRRIDGYFFEKIRKHKSCDIISPDSGPPFFFVDRDLFGKLRDEFASGIRFHSVFDHMGNQHKTHFILGAELFLPGSEYHLANKVKLNESAFALSNIIALAYERDAYEYTSALAWTSETDGLGMPILLAHSAFKLAIDSFGCKGVEFRPVYNCDQSDYHEMVQLISDASDKVGWSGRNYWFQRVMRNP